MTEEPVPPRTTGLDPEADERGPPPDYDIIDPPGFDQ
jgi:hypothetical protein